MAELSPKQHYLKHLGQLKNERTSFEEHWRELAEFIDLLWSNLNGHFDRVFSPRQGT
ncbi:hypothetical protein ABEK08_19510 [Klebsiella pneumoniae]